MTWRAALAALGGAALAFAGGRLTAPVAAPAARPAPVCVARLDDATLRELRIVVATAAQPAAAPLPATAPPPATAAAPPPPADDEARAIADAALARGAWTDEDAAALRGHPDAEVMRSLAQAVNEGRLSLETQGPPF